MILWLREDPKSFLNNLPFPIAFVVAAAAAAAAVPAAAVDASAAEAAAVQLDNLFGYWPAGRFRRGDCANFEHDMQKATFKHLTITAMQT